MILITIQFSCDNPGCNQMRQVNANLESATEKMNRMLEDGWLRKGNKVYCPQCDEVRIRQLQSNRPD